ncbi:MAG TPA: zeta toxin family protein [Candidatus Elarobacter sp.]|nr:zeta toxin family protein [Candidatus Elarobacter sp.]
MTSRRAPRERAPRPTIYVLAGVNGAGKSSVAGAAIRASGGEYFNPDEATLRLLVTNPRMDPSVANALAWSFGRCLLECAIADHLDYAFETTLGGATITQLLETARDAGLDLHMRYVGLESPALHIARVRARVAAGGHDIPEAKIRERYDSSRRNLIRLLPRLTDLVVYDNSVDAPPLRGEQPVPRTLLHVTNGKVVDVVALDTVPRWARPIVMAALRLGA